MKETVNDRRYITLVAGPMILSLSLGAIVVFAQNGGNVPAETEALYESPRLRRLAADLRSGNNEAFTNFCTEMAGKAPLIEPVENDTENRWFTYLWLGDESTREVGIYWD